MAVFKCKMCGGTLNIQENDSVAVCDYCGTKQTVPRLSDDRRMNLYDRANHFRRNNEFDKAMGIYEQILNEDQTDAEAYWSLVLCRYGIEYVEDPATHKRVPTVNRTQYTSIFADEDYKSALQYADGAQRAVYEKEAKAIDEIQKGILAISQREKPFDVFICYKETDQNGRRTQDSVLANDLYHQLTQEGFKVFFSRITLEDKLGTAYEPYIFAALHSAKVMVVLGTKPEYFNAVWVKNEWSRYLALIRSGEKKILIPAYRDMDPYDLPEEFSHLQAQDMSKLGFMQDLIRGIRKMLNAGDPTQAAPAAAPVTGAVPVGVDPLLKRAALFLEDGAWDSALEYFEKVLDLNPECAQAYMGRLLAARRVRHEKEIAGETKRIDGEPDFQKALRFADGKYKEQLEGYASAILDRYYQQGLVFKQQGDGEGYEQAIECFELISDYKDSARQIEECRNLNVEYLKKSLYDSYMEKKQELFGLEMSEKGDQALPDELHKLQQDFEKMGDYRDAPQQAAACQERANELVYQSLLDRKQQLDRAERTSSYSWIDLASRLRTLGEYRDAPALAAYCENKNMECGIAETKRNRKIGIIVLSTVAGVVAAALLVTQVIMPAVHYSRGVELRDSGDYLGAVSEFWAADGYKDSEDILPQLLLTCQSISGKYHTVGLKSDGTVVAVGDNANNQCNVSSWTDIVSVAAGTNHTVGLKSDGTVVAVGDNNYSQCDVAGWTEIVAISAGTNHTVGLKSDGTVVAVGSTPSGQYDVSSWTGIIAVSAGINHTFGLKSDGTVVAVGYNSDSQCDVSSWTDIIDVSAGSYHTVGLKSDGTVVAAGDNDYGQCDVSGWTDIIAVSAGTNHTVGLKSDGTVVAAGDNSSARCHVSDWSDIVAIAAGGYHTVGLKSDGTVVAVGYNSDGQCDVSDWTDIKVPGE